LRIKITLEHPEGKETTFPLYYNHTLQGFIYHHLSLALANFLHKKGYSLGKRKFKLFTFSRLFGKFRINPKEEKITFSGPVSFYLSSPLKKVIEECAENLIKSPDIYLSKNPLIIKSIEVFPSISSQSDVTIRMLSPLTVYSTLFSASGKKKTYYYSPMEEEFSQSVKANILKKYQALQEALYGEKFPSPYCEIPQRKELDSFQFRISPLKLNKNSEKIIKYIPSSNYYTLAKNSSPSNREFRATLSGSYTLIKAWLGTYRIQGDSELISLAYDAGLGSKNSQGFGMFEII